MYGWIDWGRYEGYVHVSFFFLYFSCSYRSIYLSTYVVALNKVLECGLWGVFEEEGEEEGGKYNYAKPSMVCIQVTQEGKKEKNSQTNKLHIHPSHVSAKLCKLAK